jgi:hypothetical protein
MSNHTPLTCGVLGSEQCGLAGVPDDHEQSGSVGMSASPVIHDRCCTDRADSYGELSGGFRLQKVGYD